jgi:hypothetical protein
MSTRTERTLTGAFRATHLAADTWRLKTAVAGAAEIYLSGVDKDAFATLRDAELRAVTLAWSAAGADVTLILPGASARFRSRTATIHEPRPLIYEGLPLVVLDKAAKRFWRRVFFIARMPGGRRVLSWIAQRRRG